MVNADGLGVKGLIDLFGGGVKEARLFGKGRNVFADVAGVASNFVSDGVKILAHALVPDLPPPPPTACGGSSLQDSGVAEMVVRSPETVGTGSHLFANHPSEGVAVACAPFDLNSALMSAAPTAVGASFQRSGGGEMVLSCQVSAELVWCAHSRCRVVPLCPPDEVFQSMVSAYIPMCTEDVYGLPNSTTISQETLRRGNNEDMVVNHLLDITVSKKNEYRTINDYLGKFLAYFKKEQSNDGGRLFLQSCKSFCQSLQPDQLKKVTYQWLNTLVFEKPFKFLHATVKRMVAGFSVQLSRFNMDRILAYSMRIGAGIKPEEQLPYDPLIDVEGSSNSKTGSLFKWTPELKSLFIKLITNTIQGGEVQRLNEIVSSDQVGGKSAGGVGVTDALRHVNQAGRFGTRPLRFFHSSDKENSGF